MHVAEPHFAEWERHEREFAAIEFLQMRFENTAGDAGDRAFAGTIEAGNLCVQLFIEIELTGGEQYRKLAEEYRRLADMAITAQEHTGLKLGDVSAQLDYLREQNASLHKILKEVE